MIETKKSGAFFLLFAIGIMSFLSSCSPVNVIQYNPSEVCCYDIVQDSFYCFNVDDTILSKEFLSFTDSSNNIGFYINVSSKKLIDKHIVYLEILNLNKYPIILDSTYSMLMIAQISRYFREMMIMPDKKYIVSYQLPILQSSNLFSQPYISLHLRAYNKEKMDRIYSFTFINKNMEKLLGNSLTDKNDENLSTKETETKNKSKGIKLNKTFLYIVGILITVFVWGAGTM